ncbi:DUF882 domain-containing protein [Devosia neptuniae]|uniref:DUF882 domain-containing protein n=1 Tax=Devosia neptuniae TaxID=191302 RepID=UPI0034DD48C6
MAFDAAAREVGFVGFGFYPRSGFIHVDLGPARQWGDRFPVRHPASRAVSRYAPLGVHRDRARGISVTIYARLNDWKQGRR